MHDWSILVEFIESDVWNFEVSDQNSIVRGNEYSFFFFFQEDRYTVEYNLKLISNNINDRDNIDLFHSFKQIDNFVSSLRLRIKFIDRLHRLSIYRRIIKMENYFYRLIGLIRVDTLHEFTATVRGSFLNVGQRMKACFTRLFRYANSVSPGDTGSRMIEKLHGVN